MHERFKHSNSNQISRETRNSRAQISPDLLPLQGGRSRRGPSVCPGSRETEKCTLTAEFLPHPAAPVRASGSAIRLATPPFRRNDGGLPVNSQSVGTDMTALRPAGGAPPCEVPRREMHLHLLRRDVNPYLNFVVLHSD